MEGFRRLMVVETGTGCSRELRCHGFDVLAMPDTNAAFHTATTVDGIVIHVDASEDADDRTTLVRRLQASVATRHVPIVIAITGRPDRRDTVAVQKFGGALIVVTNAQFEGVAAIVDDLLDIGRSQAP
jgi:PleD family two-component response regulator